MSPASQEAAAVDVVVYYVKYGDNPGESSIVSYGRDNFEVAKEFCRRPKWPANPSDSFIAVDDWGHGNIVAATPDLESHIGTPYAKFKREFH